MALVGVISAETSSGSSLKLARRQTPLPAALYTGGVELKAFFAAFFAATSG
jgi:hypothetical protein